jgi:hypothetical protein
MMIPETATSVLGDAPAMFIWTPVVLGACPQRLKPAVLAAS